MRPFTFERARTPAEAANAAARHPGAKFVAGGTNLLDLMKLEIETPPHLIDVNGLALDKIDGTPEGGLRIGALVRNTDLAADTLGAARNAELLDAGLDLAVPMPDASFDPEIDGLLEPGAFVDPADMMILSLT